jgi:hypothetical protein
MLLITSSKGTAETKGSGDNKNLSPAPKLKPYTATRSQAGTFTISKCKQSVTSSNTDEREHTATRSQARTITTENATASYFQQHWLLTGYCCMIVQVKSQSQKHLFRCFFSL